MYVYYMYMCHVVLACSSVEVGGEKGERASGLAVATKPLLVTVVHAHVCSHMLRVLTCADVWVQVATKRLFVTVVLKERAAERVPPFLPPSLPPSLPTPPHLPYQNSQVRYFST